LEDILVTERTEFHAELTEPSTLTALWALCLGSVPSVAHALVVRG